jgi:anti-sigma factor RsiW
VSNSNGTIGDHPVDDLAAYALDALDDAERLAVDDHLTHCLACRAELAGHHETLATLTSDEAPPAAIWQRVTAGIDAAGLLDPPTAGPAPAPAPSSPAAARRPDPLRPTSAARTDAAAGTDEATGPEVDDAVGTVHSLAPATEARTGRSSGRRWLAAAAACLVAAAVTGGAVGYAVGSSSDDDADIGSLAERAADDPAGVLATLDDTSGQPVAKVVADQDGAFVVLSGLQDLPEGRAYQLWSLTGPQPVSLGMLGRYGTNTVAFRLPPTITELAISVAPTSGEVAPTGDFSASGSVTRS